MHNVIKTNHIYMTYTNVRALDKNTNVFGGMIFKSRIIWYLSELTSLQ